MGRIKKKDWKLATFSLDPIIQDKLKDISDFEGMSKSEMLELLVNNWNAGIDPSEKIKLLLKEKEKITIKLNTIDEEINKTAKQIALFEEWNKHKRVKKSEAINIIKRKILNKEYEEAERISKVWQRITGINAIELLIEAKGQIERTGI